MLMGIKKERQKNQIYSSEHPQTSQKIITFVNVVFVHGVRGANNYY